MRNRAGNVMSDPRLLRLHASDNVVTVISTIEPGTSMEVEGVCVTSVAHLPIGHKIAARDIAAAEKVIKYGAPIGSATCDIAVGEHVHVHNLKSDYLPTWLREDQARLFTEQSVRG